MSSVVQEQRIRALEKWRAEAEVARRDLEERMARFMERLEEIRRDRSVAHTLPAKEAERVKPR